MEGLKQIQGLHFVVHDCTYFHKIITKKDKDFKCKSTIFLYSIQLIFLQNFFMLHLIVVKSARPDLSYYKYFDLLFSQFI